MVVSNSIVVGNSGGGIQGQGAVSYSDVWGNDSNIDPATRGPFVAAFDPYFVNPGNHDYHLAPSSLFTDFSSTGGQIGAYGPGSGLPTSVRGVSPVSGDWRGGAARLVWYTSDGVGRTAPVYRQLGNQDWAAVGVGVADGSGYISFVDQNPPAGRVGYGVGVNGSAGVGIEGEMWVDIPVVERLGIEVVGGNPIRDGRLMAEVTMPEAGIARVAVLDASGRQVIARQFNVDAGRNAVDVGEGQNLRPGVYWLRLTHGGSSKATRVVVLK
jgi:hypothetical protein